MQWDQSFPSNASPSEIMLIFMSSQADSTKLSIKKFGHWGGQICQKEHGKIFLYGPYWFYNKCIDFMGTVKIAL